ncbi:unnamed protein product [Diatraea saccharalis]|uniref:Peptidase M12A domain-containing protein n=1 Tax=Diatraea saccharalis TaxID=40085 RepID=A0A9N9W874_9NEOP|nr:unnamed protein product [Diatraea saccharalis]
MELRDVFAMVLVCYVVKCTAMSISELEDFANFLKKTSHLDETLKKGTDANDFDEDESVSDHAWEESGKFEGDLVLNERQRRMIVEDIAEGLSRNGLRDSTKKWPDNEVIYYIQKEHFTEEQVDAIRSGIEDLARASCVKFRPYQRAARHNFRKYNAFAVSDFGVGYDYDSVLHYSRRAFSSNGQDTIVPKQNGAQIGQRVGLSDKDAQKLNKMYCDADSNSEGEETTTKKVIVKKKTPKNKPFDGHGIGYHQGKTVVIKLLPEKKAETYHIIVEPQYNLFDHFSKTPQALPATKSEGFGKSLGDFSKSYNVDDVYNRVKSKVPEYRNLESITSNMNNNKTVVDTNKIVDNVKKDSSKTLDEKSKEKNAETLSISNDELIEAFNRLSKILKTHVYPSHTPDFGSYTLNADYMDFSNRGKDPKKINNNNPLFSDKLSEVLKNSTSEYIKSLHNDGPVSLISEKKQQNPDRIVVDPEKFKNIEIEQNISKEENKPSTTKEQNKATTSAPFKNQLHFSTESPTPIHVTYEHLKNIRNYSEIYNPSDKQENIVDKNHYKSFVDTPFAYDDWYKKQDLKHLVDYDKDLFTDNKYGKKNDFKYFDDSFEYEPQSSNEYYTDLYSPEQEGAYTSFESRIVPLDQDWHKFHLQSSQNYQPHQRYYSVENKSGE